MSRSPEIIDKDTPKERVEQYLAASENLNRMILAGQSFSGHERNCVYLNTLGPRFANISSISGLDFADDGRGIGLVDWDFDGDMDMWICNRTGPRLRFMRNDLPKGNYFLKVLLVGNGESCNRDAIGARLELRVNGLTLLRTLRAGEGFLSQNSKWLHFGLGTQGDIESLLVRWPDGKEQTFTDISPDKFYKITQGNDLPTLWTPPANTFDLKPSVITQRPSLQKAQLIIGSRTPLPRLSFTDLNGSKHDVRDLLQKPLLLNLWATWCEPCKQELAHLSKSGIHMLALSVDGLGQDSTTTRDDARQFIIQNGYKFPAGYADQQLVQLLQVYHNALFMNARPLPIPTSFLIDTNGYVGAIYKGPVTADRIREDIAHLNDTPDEHRARSIPFKGRWIKSAPNVTPIQITRRMVEDNMLDEAITYFEHFGANSSPARQIPLMETIISKLRKQNRHELADKIEIELKKISKKQPPEPQVPPTSLIPPQPTQ